ncbi:MAG: FAD-binding protein [Candidatus Shapirobacteria bacterium]|nr:FAD-binding protein [Candidatus Shapirobacteria bacterium]
MDLNKVFTDLKNNFPNLKIYQNHPLAQYTTVKIGGPADIFINTQNSEEFLDVLKYLKQAEATIFEEHSSQGVLPQGSGTAKNSLQGENLTTVLGNGSNVLISDSGIRGIVIKNDSQKVDLLPENKVKVSSGTQLSYLINFTLDHNLVGLEEFAYIPSTVGGAIAGNIHGVNKINFSKFVESVEKYDDFIISAILNLKSGDSAPAKAQVQEIIQKKAAVQSMNSLGSVFKNIPNQDPTGMIIDQKLNLKGYSIGGAQISPKHANFIINNGSATAKDYLALINLIQSQMQTKFGFQFELEIKLLGNF